MSPQGQTPSEKRIYDLKVTANLMTLDAGLFCLFHVRDQQPADERGFPGIRISLPPYLENTGKVEIVGFEKDGWLGAEKSAALVRVIGEPAQILVTIYQDPANGREVPQLQVVRLNDAPDAVKTAQALYQPAAPAFSNVQQGQSSNTLTPPAPNSFQSELSKAGVKVVSHLQVQGDVAVPVGEWIGIPGSQHWIEGFGVAPGGDLSATDIEYHAVLGKGWFSPWQEGGQFCGSRGMALPILGLAVRIKGKKSSQYYCRLTATFTDGTHIGPVVGSEPVSSYTLAPLEAFRLEILTKKELEEHPAEALMPDSKAVEGTGKKSSSTRKTTSQNQKSK